MSHNVDVSLDRVAECVVKVAAITSQLENIGGGRVRIGGELSFFLQPQAVLGFAVHIRRFFASR